MKHDMCAARVLPEIPEKLLARVAELGPRWSENIPRHVTEMVEAFRPVLTVDERLGEAIVRFVRAGE